jgi:hypothetical protein
MPKVPMLDTPQVSESTQGPGLLQVQGSVKPMENFAPKQQQQLGASMQKAGNTMKQISDRITDQLNDAEAAQLFNEFSMQAEEMEFNFGRTQGADALRGFDGIREQYINLQTQYAERASNDVVGFMFRNQSASRLRSGIRRMANHSATQGDRYYASEAQAQANNYAQEAARNWDTYAVPDGEFRTNLDSAIIQAGRLAERMGIPEDSAQFREMVGKINTQAWTGVIQGLANDGEFVEGVEILEREYENGNILPTTYNQLRRQLDTGYDTQQAVAAADSIWTQASGFDGSAANAANAVSLGLNENTTPHPDYQGANGIDRAGRAVEGMGNLVAPENRALATAAMYIFGGDEGYAMIEANLENPSALAEALNSKINSMTGVTEDQVAAYRTLVNSLPTQLSTGGDGRANQPNLGEMLRVVRETVQDPEQRDLAEAEITRRYNEGVQLQTENYNAAFQNAQEIAFAEGGSWRDVPAELMSQLRPEDRAKIVEGPSRGDDPDTMIYLYDNPAARTLEGDPANNIAGLSSYRHLLSEATYQSFYRAATTQEEPRDVRAATIDNEILNNQLLQAGLTDYLDPQSDAQKQAVIQLRAEVEDAIYDEQIRNGNRPLSRDQTRSIIQSILRDTVTIEGGYTSFDRAMPIAMVPAGSLGDAFVTYNGTLQPSLRGQEFRIASIPVDVAPILQAALEADNIPVNQQNLINRWVDLNQPANAQALLGNQ